jgi:acetyl esterase/lipase
VSLFEGSLIRLVIERSVSFPHGVQGSLGAAGQVQLGQNVGNVTVDRGQADDQLIGDFLVAQPLGHQLQCLHFPAGAHGSFPAVVMLHGSGADTRDVFWRTGDAEVFLRAGLAVFIYDKRGTGESGGDWQAATIEDLAGDALAAVRLQRGRANIKADQVGIFGVSQGGRLTPVIAAASIGDFSPRSPRLFQNWLSAAIHLLDRSFLQTAILAR